MLTSNDIGIDLGNSKFSICVRGSGIVASEAAYLAYSGEIPHESNLVAVGNEALEMFERAPKNIKVVTPMRSGIVVDCRVGGIILRQLMKKSGIKQGWSKPKVLVAALFGSTDVERKAFSDVAANIRGKSLSVVHEPLAAANALGIDISGPSANMIVDVGDGATEALVLSLGESVLGHSMRFGGADIDNLLMDHIRKSYGLIISKSQARCIKEKIALEFENKAAFISLKGITVHGYLPIEKSVPLSDFTSVVDQAADVISEFVLNTLNQTLPEVSVDLIENGIYLCGGASQFARIKELIALKTKLEVKSVPMPQDAVANGLCQMLKYA